MKKLVLTMAALVAGAMLVHAQGLVTINAGTAGTVKTNGATLGSASTTYGTYNFELLDMTAAAWGGLSGAQQTAAGNVFQNPSAVSLWTDSGVSGATSLGLSAGKINGLGAAAGTTAANWAAPSGTTYSTGGIDYYAIVGWTTGGSLNTWAQVVAALNGNTLPSTSLSFYGESAVYYNYAGGGANNLSVVNVWATSAGSTGLAGAGTPNGDVAGSLILNPVPEPTTLALAGLGGISMLFLRRRKA